MASCKDCIHFEVCGSLGMEVYRWGRKPTLQIFLDKYKAEHCTRFNPRSRFVELPIKPGEKIYYFDTVGRIYKSTVERLVYTATGFLIDSDVMFNSNLIGARFFLTREEAEQALKEREGNDN